MRRTIKLSLRNLFLQCIDHTENKNPLLLDQKEKMIEANHPWHDRFARFTVQEAQHGLLDELDDMQLALQWHLRLKEAGLMIRGYRLLYREGVGRKRLPPKRLFTAGDATKLDERGTYSVDGKHLNEPESHSLPSEPRGSIGSLAIDSKRGRADDSNYDCGDESEIDIRDLPADDSIDADVEDVQMAATEKPLELPTRSRRFGVGKEIGYAVYVHRVYEDRLGPAVQWAKRYLPVRYEYDVVKLNQRNDSVSFILCPGFDFEPEPAIAAIMVVGADGSVQRRALPADPYIYHHKWLFVADDYQGFDVAHSMRRSEQWIGLADVDRARIGRKSFWEKHVVPRINVNR